MDPISALLNMSIVEWIMFVIILVVTIWIYYDPDKRTRFFLSNPSMAITLWSIAVMLSPSWYIFEPIRLVGLYIVAYPWLIMCTFAYGIRLYTYIIKRMLEEGFSTSRTKVSWREYAPARGRNSPPLH